MTIRNSPGLPPHRPLAPRPQERAAQAPPIGRSFTSRDLFAGESEITIIHQGAAYRLKITRQGKLILNK